MRYQFIRSGDPYQLLLMLSLVPLLVRGRLAGWLARRDGILPRTWSERAVGVATWVLVLLAAATGAVVYWACSASAAPGLPWMLAAAVEVLRMVLNGIAQVLLGEDWD